MNIRNKLLLSVTITIVGIAVIATVSLLGIRFVEGKLKILTEQSTPQQLKNIEMQHSLQEHASALLRLAGIQASTDLATARSEVENSAADVSRIEGELERLAGPAGDNSKVMALLQAITAETLDATVERLQVEEAARAAGTLVKTRLHEVDHSLETLNRSMSALQMAAARQLVASRDRAREITQDLMDMTVARDLLKDIIAAISETQRADNRKALLIARSRLDTAFSKFSRNRLVVVRGPGIRDVGKLIAEVRQLAGGSDGLLELKAVLISGTGGEQARQRYEQRLYELEGRLTVAMATLAQEITLASAQYDHENASHDLSLRHSAAASETVTLSGQLISLGLDMSMLSQDLLDADAIVDLERAARQLREALTSSAGALRKLRAALGDPSRHELKLLNGVGSALDEVKQLLLAKEGVVDQLRQGLAVRQKAQALNERLLSMVAQRREQGLESIRAAQAEQSTTVQSVRQMVERNVATLAAVSLGVLLFAVVAGMLVVRAITAPTARLVRVMARVSQEGDYSARAPIESSDEIGKLAGGFNVMLEQIQDRDQQLAAHRDKLEHEVELRTADLCQARDLAEAGSRAKSDFLATMSHEIRTPMNGILGMTELLRGSALNPQQRRFADAVYQSGEHLLNVINDILDFSKIEAGKLEIETIHFNLRQLIEDVACMFAQPAEAKDLEMVCDIPFDLPVAVSGDPVRLRQIMTNLVNNAVKFTSRGEIVIRVLLLNEDPLQARFRFEIRDTGIGIDTATQSRLFSAFVQADSSTTRRFGGTGLGLTIAKHLVEMMNGEIDLHSEVGRGTVFSFELPLGKQNPDARSALDLAESLRGLRILVVDDNDTNREILAHQIHGWSMHPIGASSGNEALQTIDRPTTGAFDLAILDLHMPEMDGFALAHAIKAKAGCTTIPLVMLSSVSIGTDHPGRQSAPIDYYLTKPVRQSDLYDAIATAMSLQRVRSLAARPQPSVAAAVPDKIGGRVLVAEDNPVNQQVAAAMLDSLGVSYCLAANGRVAIEQLARTPFDLVLMDCQMPEMDGLEATAQIRARQREGRLPHHLPVVALTANAVEGDRERCLAAGMDDYLSKPFSCEQLRSIVMRWLPQSTDMLPGTQAPPATTSNETGKEVADEPINPRALDIIRHLPGPNGAHLVNKVISAYLSDTPKRSAQMRAAAEAGDAEALRKSAHGMKSSSANVGAEQLAALCRDLELIGRAGSVDGATDLLQRVESESVRVFEALAAQQAGAMQEDGLGPNSHDCSRQPRS